ncbi:MAG: hypothetical protein ACTHYN_03345 [Marinobacter sp.]|uniref:hypothetical protein n=1 Tax=Marinobacter sp. TaxID=50741 RepID=UPI003F975F89
MAEQLNLELRTHATATGIDTDSHRLLLGDSSLRYSKLVLACARALAKSLTGERTEMSYGTLWSLFVAKSSCLG